MTRNDEMRRLTFVLRGRIESAVHSREDVRLGCGEGEAWNSCFNVCCRCSRPRHGEKEGREQRRIKEMRLGKG